MQDGFADGHVVEAMKVDVEKDRRRQLRSRVSKLERSESALTIVGWAIVPILTGSSLVKSVLPKECKRLTRDLNPLR